MSINRRDFIKTQAIAAAAASAGISLPQVAAAQDAGAAVLFGDPGRAYLPAAGIEPLAVYDVPVPRAIEDRDIRTTRVWRFI